jgi:hypothetical protein
MPKAQIRPQTDEEATARMVTNDRSWPLWPILPLKNRKIPSGESFPTMLGFLCAPPDKPEQGFTVYVGVIPQYTGKSPVEYPTMQYNDLAAFLAAGWEVD